MVGTHVDEVDDFGAMMVERQGRGDRDADVAKLRDLGDGEWCGVEGKLTVYDPLCVPTKSTGLTGFMKNHEVGFGS